MERKIIVKNMSPEFYDHDKNQDIYGKPFNSMPASDKYERLINLARDLPKNIIPQEMQFNRAVELNFLRKSPHTVIHSVSKRRGFDVHTFEFINCDMT